MADVLTIPDEGLNYFNECQTGKRTPETIRLALFVSNTTVTASSVVADFTQMSTHGITTKDLVGSSWAAAAVTAGQSISAYAAQEFTATATDDGTATDVYGYIAYSVTSSKLLWAVKFDSAKPITYENEKITIVPENRGNQKP